MFKGKFSKLCALLLVCGILFSTCPVSYAMSVKPNPTKQGYDMDENVKQESGYDERGGVVIDIDYKHNGDNIFPNSHGWEWKYIPSDKKPERDTRENEDNGTKKGAKKAAKKMAKKMTTGATVGTIIYYIISEGSRFVFPVRNLVPVL